MCVVCTESMLDQLNVSNNDGIMSYVLLMHLVDYQLFNDLIISLYRLYSALRNRRTSGPELAILVWECDSVFEIIQFTQNMENRFTRGFLSSNLGC